MTHIQLNVFGSTTFRSEDTFSLVRRARIFPGQVDTARIAMKTGRKTMEPGPSELGWVMDTTELTKRHTRPV